LLYQGSPIYEVVPVVAAADAVLVRVVGVREALDGRVGDELEEPDAEHGRRVALSPGHREGHGVRIRDGRAVRFQRAVAGHHHARQGEDRRLVSRRPHAHQEEVPVGGRRPPDDRDLVAALARDGVEEGPEALADAEATRDLVPAPVEGEALGFGESGDGLAQGDRGDGRAAGSRPAAAAAAARGQDGQEREAQDGLGWHGSLRKDMDPSIDRITVGARGVRARRHARSGSPRSPRVRYFARSPVSSARNPRGAVRVIVAAKVATGLPQSGNCGAPAEDSQ
jgi:hypothetical protein